MNSNRGLVAFRQLLSRPLLPSVIAHNLPVGVNIQLASARLSVGGSIGTDRDLYLCVTHHGEAFMRFSMIT